MGYKSNIASNLINQALRLVIGALTGIVVARALGPEGMGYAAYIILIFTLIGDFGHLGLNNSIMYFKKRGGGDPAQLYNVNVTMLGLLSVAIAAVVAALKGTGLALNSYGYPYLAGGIAFAAADLLFTSHHSWLIGDQRIPESNRSIIIVFFLKSAVLLTLWLTRALTPLSYFLVFCLSMLLNAVLLIARVRQPYRPAIDLRLLRSQFSYGTVIWLGAICAFLHYRVDQLMIKSMLGLSDLGVYSVAVTLAELMFLLPASINSALLGKLYNTDDPQAARKVVSQTLKLSFYVCAVLALTGIPLSLLIPVFYGQAYAGAVFSTMILLAGVVFASLAKVSAQNFFSRGQPGFHLAATFAALLLNAGLNLLFIPRLGIAGAALASTLSYFFYGSYYLALFVLREKFSLSDIFALRTEDLRDLLRRGQA